MSQKISVSVGIPAYNEEANIAKIITQLLTQKEDNFSLLEVIIVSDGSTDRTVSQSLSINDPRVIVLDRKTREGGATRQNDIIQNFKGEALIILDADIYIPNEFFVSTLVAPIIANSRIGIVAARVSPLESANFIEKVINCSVKLKREMYEQINHQNNIYLCQGRGRAFSKEFASKLVFPKEAGEDAFSYIQCTRMGFEFQYEPKAELFYRSPQTLRDHLKQSKRFFISKSIWERINKHTLKSYYHIPVSILFKTTAKYFYNHPILTIAYIAVYGLARITSLWYQTGTLWDVSMSSKIVTK